MKASEQRQKIVADDGYEGVKKINKGLKNEREQE